MYHILRCIPINTTGFKWKILILPKFQFSPWIRHWLPKRMTHVLNTWRFERVYIWLKATRTKKKKTNKNYGGFAGGVGHDYAWVTGLEVVPGIMITSNLLAIDKASLTKITVLSKLFWVEYSSSCKFQNYLYEAQKWSKQLFLNFITFQIHLF